MNVLKLALVVSVLAITAGCISPVKTVQALNDADRGNLKVAGIYVSYSTANKAKIRELDQKVADKRAEKGLPPIDRKKKYTEDQYSTLPLSLMLGYVVKDALIEKGYINGRAVKFSIEIDALKFANAGLVLLAGDNDQLSGMVTVKDAETDSQLAQFYVDVLEGSGGLLGLAARGGGVREKMASDFAELLIQELEPKK